MNVTDDFDNVTFSNCTNNEKEALKIIFKYLLLSTPSEICFFL